MIGRSLITLALVITLAACSPGNTQTDRIAATVARSISFPRQNSAEGLLRAAVGTAGSRDLAVLVAEDLKATELDDPLARLVFRVHLDGTLSGFVRTDPITACYEAEFNFYGAIGSPKRVGCPDGAKAIVPKPLPSSIQVEIPQGFENVLKGLLADLPAAPDPDAVSKSLVAGLTGLADLAPTVETAVRGADVGVSLWDPEDRECLLGVRIGGRVEVGRPSRVQMQPGELSCDPQTAFQLFKAPIVRGRA